MPIDTSPGGTDIIDRSGNGKGVDIDSDIVFELPILPELLASRVPVPDYGSQILFIDSADGKLKRKNSSGTVTIIG